MSAVVLLCSDGVAAGFTASERAGVSVIDGLCRDPRQIGAAVHDGDRLVLGVCQGEYSLGAIQAAARRAGIDPLGIELIDLTTADESALDVTLNARIQRAEAFAGSSPANAKISVPRTLNRRELLRGPQHEYHAAPSVDAERCAAQSGCRACVDLCPQRALSINERQLHYDRSICEPCGLCVTSCPTGATVNPAITPSQLRAEIEALLDPSSGPAGTRAIVFTCSHGSQVRTATGSHMVTVPCTGMVPAGWLLAPLLMGAGGVGVVPCGDSGCGFGHDTRSVAAVEFCRALLQAIGHSPDRVSTEQTNDPPEPLPEVVLTDPFGPHGAVEVMRGLASRHKEAKNVVVDHVRAPTGIVRIRTDVCTGCTRCAEICPTGALAFTNSDDRVAISFDAARCTACSQCINACPEIRRGAISLQATTDLQALSAGRQTLIDTDVIVCESCGGPIGPAPMIARISKMLGNGQEPIRAMIMSRCVSCRGTPG